MIIISDMQIMIYNRNNAMRQFFQIIAYFLYQWLLYQQFQTITNQTGDQISLSFYFFVLFSK